MSIQIGVCGLAVNGGSIIRLDEQVKEWDATGG